MTVNADIPTASTKKGAIRTRSTRFHRRRSHHTHSINAKGSTTVDGLLSMAASPHATDNAYQPCFSSASNRRKHSMDKKKNNPNPDIL